MKTPVVKLQSTDGVTFDVEVQIVTRFKAVKTLMEDLGIEAGDEDVIPIEVNSEVLKVVLEWAKHHKDESDPEPDQKKEKDPMSKWDKENLDRAEPGLLFEIIVASKTLDINWLQTLACGRVQSMIHGKTPTQLRKIFGLTNDFSKEEEEKARQENSWCEEK